MAEESKLPEQLRRMEALLGEVDQFADAQARGKTRQIVQALMDMHGAALEKILDGIAAGPGVGLIEALAADPLVGSLLLLYGLHPVELEIRVGEALEKVRPYLHSHGGNVELLGIADGVVRLRLQGSCHGCPSSAATLKQTIEQAILEKAPDAAGIEVENEPAATETHPEAAGRVALTVIR
ncbi:MAG TPA: NifU family protein [Tepidisphaeraceae bacterium]|nr:NifU family protein [Tepidisphaeraceae bacterium]